MRSWPVIGMVPCMVLVCTFAPPAVADDAMPWDNGVTEAARQEAIRLRDDGNTLFIAEQYPDAAAKFEAALTLWPHPKLHFAAGISLMKLGRWLDAATAFEKALVHGESGLGDDLSRARGALGEANAHLGVMIVSSTQHGAELSLDGKVVLTAPGSVRVRVMPGRHVVAAKRGALSADPESFEVGAGQETAGSSVLYVTESRWKWDRWKPWVVVGAGALIAASGAPMLLHGRTLQHDYNEEFGELCSMGCNPEPASLVARRESWRRWGNIATGMFVGGGVVTGLGLAWLALNRQIVTRRRAPDVIAMPWLTGTGVDVALRW